MADAQQEENLIKEYFSKGFKYKEIIEFLTKNHLRGFGGQVVSALAFHL
jgi:hypothetical protein